MMNEIETLKAELNSIVTKDEAILSSGEILKLSQKLDKLIYIEQVTMMKKEELKYKKPAKEYFVPSFTY